MEHGKHDKSRRLSARERAQQWMTKGGLIRDDSDDELGVEDHPWVWIYEDDTDSRSHSRAAPSKGPRRIVGARMGHFDCWLGEVVLLKSPEPGKDWAGIITEFVLDDEDEDDKGEPVKSANIMWLASPDEFISTKNRRRPEALPNEQYVTTDFNVNPLTSINGKAQVMSEEAFCAKYPKGRPPRGKKALVEYNKCIVCRRGVNQLQGRYTDEFVWEDVYRQNDVFELLDFVESGLKSTRKRKAEDSGVGDEPNLLCLYGLFSLMQESTSTLLRKTSRLRRQGRSRELRQRQLRSHDDSKRLLRRQLTRGG